MTRLRLWRTEVNSRADKWDMRLRPYRTVDAKIDGVVITSSTSVTAGRCRTRCKKSEQEVRELRRR